ncbi:hypothetical protein [Priestia sp. 40]|uniref:hypothetical protein n=1 Tax=Priestia sp. 40 TaxID=3394459 RepID=UPI003BF77C38
MTQRKFWSENLIRKREVMDVQKVANLFLIFVLIAAGISLVIGFVIAVRSTNYKKGYISTFISSVVFLLLIVSWYDKASSNVFMGTIPWVLNVIAVILVLPLYLLCARFIFKKVTKGQKGTNEKISG